MVRLGLEGFEDFGEGVLLVVDECDESVKSHRYRVRGWRSRKVEVCTVS